MAKKSMIERDQKRKKIVEKYAEKREALKDSIKIIKRQIKKGKDILDA